MDDLLAISMDPRVGMVQGDQPLEKKKTSQKCKQLKNWNYSNQISVDEDPGFFSTNFFNFIHINKYL